MKLITLFFLTFFLLSCQEAPSPLTTLHKISEGFLFVGTPVDYTSAGLYHLAIDDQDKLSFTPLREGESGDFVILGEGLDLFAVNRSATEHNFRSLIFSAQAERTATLTWSRPFSLSALKMGDPSAMLRLDDRYILIAGLGGGTLSLFDSQQDLLQPLHLDKLPLSEDTPFRPALLHSHNGHILIVHQGLDNHFRVNHSQSLFRARWENQKLSFIEDGHNRIAATPLQGSVTEQLRLHPHKNEVILLSSFCTEYVGIECQASFEEITSSSPSEITSHPLNHLQLTQVSRSFITDEGHIVISATNNEGMTAVFQFDPMASTTKAPQVIHTFSENPLGKGLSGFFVTPQGEIIVSEPLSATTSKLYLYRQSELLDEREISTIPSLSVRYVAFD